MDLPAFLARMRDYYVEQFRAFAEAQRRNCTVGTAELKLGGLSSPYQGYYCMDFATNDGEIQLTEFIPDKVLTFEPISIQFGAAALTIEHLRWDDILIYHDLGDLPSDEVVRWFDRWFDPEDKRSDPTALFSGIIHSFGIDPGVVSADLGTAPAESFLGLLELLERAGARTMRVSSSRAEDEAEN
jgi:hypothetical protein